MAARISVSSAGLNNSAASPTTSGNELTFAHTTGQPNDIASNGGMPNPSYSEGQTNTAAEAYKPANMSSVPDTCKILSCEMCSDSASDNSLALKPPPPKQTMGNSFFRSEEPPYARNSPSKFLYSPREPTYRINGFSPSAGLTATFCVDSQEPR